MLNFIKGLHSQNLTDSHKSPRRKCDYAHLINEEMEAREVETLAEVHAAAKQQRCGSNGNLARRPWVLVHHHAPSLSEQCNQI